MNKCPGCAGWINKNQRTTCPECGKDLREVVWPSKEPEKTPRILYLNETAAGFPGAAWTNPEDAKKVAISDNIRIAVPFQEVI
jgi:hypothetical protein